MRFSGIKIYIDLDIYEDLFLVVYEFVKEIDFLRICIERVIGVGKYKIYIFNL